MQTFEYSLHLDTGETMEIVEISMKALDAWTEKAFSDPAASKALTGLLSLCTKVPHQILEDAKIGYTKPLERLLKSPPVGALMKLDKPACFNVSDCIMADKDKCTTRFWSKAAKFPECWDYHLPQDEFTSAMAAAQEIAKVIVMAWRDGKYVIISG